MAKFRYIAKTRTGERVEGELDAPDKQLVMAQLDRMGYIPVSVASASGAAATQKAKGAPPKAEKKKSPPKKSLPASPKKTSTGAGEPHAKKWFRFEKKFSGTPQMKMGDLLLFTQEISDLLSSGMTLGTALHALAKRKTGKAQDVIVAALRDDIIQGASLSAALAKWPDTFPALFVSMTQAGEASGQLPEVLERLGKHYTRILAAREKVKSAMIYPTIVLIVGILAVAFMMVFVVPRFTMMFRDMGSELPLSTKMLIAMSDFMIKWGWALVGGGVFAYFSIKKWIKTPSGAEWKDHFVLKVPALKGIIKASAFSNFAHTLGTLMANGVQVLQALAIVENTVGNVVIAQAIRDARARVTDGSTISKPLAQGGIFPQLLTDMLAVGEESGDMSAALEHIGRRYDNELDRSVKVFTTVLEPVMMLMIAAIVGFVAISMMMAVFNMSGGLAR